MTPDHMSGTKTEPFTIYEIGGTDGEKPNVYTVE